jgi:hypothetical protein
MPRELVLPACTELEMVQAENRIYIKFAGRYIVTLTTGMRKYVRGLDVVSVNKATCWAWGFDQGRYCDNYEVEKR